MTGVMGLQIFVILITGICIVRVCLKFPKWLCIGILVLFGASMATVLFIGIYYPEVLIRLAGEVK